MISKVGYVYDGVMEKHAPRNRSREAHPECPERLRAIHSAMVSRGCEARCARIPARPATEEEMSVAHTKRYLDVMRQTSSGSSRCCAQVERAFDRDVYVNGFTWEASRVALGSAIEATLRVSDGRLAHALAAIRPPGHHACAHKAMGFCFLNTVAICARIASRESDARVLVVDWDVHHGNGTQDLLWDDPRILYFSVHRGFESRRHYGSELFYPGTGAPTEVGGAKGFTVNVRWSEPLAGDAEYRECWRRVLLPIARAFDPNLILVSAGFDAARGDPLGECRVTPRGYFHLLRPLAALGPTVLCLEGGYNLSIIGDCFAACAAALLGDADLTAIGLDDDGGSEEYDGCDPTAEADILATVDVHRRYWRCLAAAEEEEELVCEMTGLRLSLEGRRAPPEGTPDDVPATLPAPAKEEEEKDLVCGMRGLRLSAPQRPPSERAGCAENPSAAPKPPSPPPSAVVAHRSPPPSED
ncbi:hypothetical protein CTAYLR_010209 [Chrysophaeum taylorii]|uniref:histone deacetylase n=1 Tax=Chrysophaeum taylorii TaxID=2483200 RepID=A0AAD7UIS6_9STRA|nr:hypothetical protein CTAYLR_010209 [Chrysophaeum taylorii]